LPLIASRVTPEAGTTLPPKPSGNDVLPTETLDLGAVAVPTAPPFAGKDHAPSAPKPQPGGGAARSGRSRMKAVAAVCVLAAVGAIAITVRAP